MKAKQYIWIVLLVVMAMSLTQCSDDGFLFRQDDPYTVIDRPGLPSSRLLQKNNPLSFRSFKSGQGENDIIFSLEYFLNSPQVEGTAVQATHLVYKANKMYISYNTEGALIRGGMEVVDFNDPANPQVMATGIRDGEFSSLDIVTDPVSGGSWLVMVGAGLPQNNLPSPQARMFELDTYGYPVLNPQVIDLDGYTGTDIQYYGMVSGTNGAFYLLDDQTLSFVETQLQIDDARSVAYDKATQKYVILTGDPATLMTNLPGQAKTYDLGIGSLAEGSKAIVRIWNGLAFVALGEAGLKVYDLATGEEKASLARPEIPQGENPYNYVTNGVTVHDEGFVFIANGAAGVYMAKYENGSLELLGSIDLDGSVNYVEAKGEYLFAATGGKGVAIIRMAGVNGPEPVVMTNAISQASISAFSASGSGSVDRNAGHEILNKGLCWGTSSLPTVLGNRSNQGPGEGSFVSEINGLNPNTQYYVRAFATTANGTFYGPVRTFTTLPADNESTVLTDSRDGNIYETIQIGQTIWMAENLAWLPSVSPVASGSQIDSYYYVYGYNGFKTTEAKATSSYQTYGVLYNWTAAQSACPDGWHLPTDEDWQDLEEYLGMPGDEADAVRFRSSGEVGKKLKATSGWYQEGNGSNVARFNAIPAGYRARGGEYKYQGSYAPFWTATENGTLANFRGMYYFNDAVYRADWYKTAGFSVRCIKNK